MNSSARLLIIIRLENVQSHIIDGLIFCIPEHLYSDHLMPKLHRPFSSLSLRLPIAFLINILQTLIDIYACIINISMNYESPLKYSLLMYYIFCEYNTVSCALCMWICLRTVGFSLMQLGGRKGGGRTKQSTLIYCYYCCQLCAYTSKQKPWFVYL